MGGKAEDALCEDDSTEAKADAKIMNYRVHSRHGDSRKERVGDEREDDRRARKLVPRVDGDMFGLLLASNFQIHRNLSKKLIE
ncbi:hypothetical protein GOP47_0010653 [Adiantum capillus-veneris]|uniref:Uncharacterized protein n=1 Tax=Adiantum capillus-veneris TaxID=13818 RepID=A0A9D4ZHZ9_ADICA|nr:hypothetical protein GOP47_0010653 [Adiantum capillus-veneris]